MANVDFSRVPDGTASLIKQSTSQAQQIAASLPSAAPGSWADVAFVACLTVVLQDWVDNNNTDGLLPDDIEDLRALVVTAANVALEQDFAHRDSTFRVVVKAMLEDWLKNWNPDADSR